jgi:hypothetical protein
LRWIEKFLNKQSTTITMSFSALGRAGNPEMLGGDSNVEMLADDPWIPAVERMTFKENT